MDGGAIGWFGDGGLGSNKTVHLSKSDLVVNALHLSNRFTVPRPNLVASQLVPGAGCGASLPRTKVVSSR